MKITCIAKSKGLTAAKLERITELALRLGKLRTEIWNAFGSIKGVNLTHRQIRDKWLAEKKTFNVPARLWKETLRDVIDDIHLYCEAAKEKVKKAIPKRMAITPQITQRAKRLMLDNFDQYFRNSKAVSSFIASLELYFIVTEHQSEPNNCLV
jgi:hypothetical protein